MDDGVAARLGPDRFYLTATTGNAEAIFQWLELWRATWRLNVTILDQTAGRAALNLAGPKARAVLQHAWYFDSFVAAMVDGPGRLVAAWTAYVFDLKIIDGAVNGVATLVRDTGSTVRRIQTGFVRNYALAVAAGAVALFAFVVFRTA